MTGSAATVSPSRRDRVRAATIEEIKGAALRLMREQGMADFKFSEVARLLGMTPPALYRYFADRDELITELIVDAFRDLQELVAAALESVPPNDLLGRVLAAAQSYRAWARREPQLFALIFAVPLPGFACPPGGPVNEAARPSFVELSMIFHEARRQGRLGKPLIRSAGPAFVQCVAGDAGEHFGDIVEQPETLQAMLHLWSAVHGITTLEAYGHLDWLDEQARDELFEAQVRQAAIAAGLPADSGAGPAEPRG